GQHSLAFSNSERLTPVTTDVLAGVQGTFCVKARPHDETLLPHSLDWDPPEQGEQIYAPKIEEIDPPPFGTDGGFRVQFAGEDPFEVRIIEDARPSRLYRTP